MACLNGSALGLYHLTGGFNTFHALALISLATVAAGVAQALGRRRWRNWLWRHYQYMAWSYVALLAATCNEAFVRVPPLQRLAAGTTAPLPLLGTAAVVVLSGVVIFGMQRRLLARYTETTEEFTMPSQQENPGPPPERPSFFGVPESLRLWARVGSTFWGGLLAGLGLGLFVAAALEELGVFKTVWVGFAAVVLLGIGQGMAWRAVRRSRQPNTEKPQNP
jgi:hypothetical protein